MTRRQSEIHRRGMELKRKHGVLEANILENLQDAQETRLYLQFDLTSLYLYVTQILGYSESIAYRFISVARKAKQFSDLQTAVMAQRLSTSKAARIASSLNAKNAASLVEFASTHTSREIDREVARINPRAAGKDSVKDLSDEFVQVTMTIRRKTFENMKRAENIHGLSPSDTLDRVYEEHLERNDPVRKAKRNKKELLPARVGDLNAAETHAVNARDEGRCTWIDSRGERCPNERWMEIHHKIRRADGGTNVLGNLTTLCSSHHRLIHTRPRDGRLKMRHGSPFAIP
jgi:hypothetical protein